MPAHATAVALLLGNSTDFCFQFAQCDGISGELAPLHSARALQSLYGAFRQLYGHLAAYLEGRRINWVEYMHHLRYARDPLTAPKQTRRYVTRRRAIPPHHNRVRLEAVLDAIAGNGDVGCKWKVDVAVVRCRESILKGIASTLALARDADIPAGCLRVVVHERCLPRWRHHLQDTKFTQPATASTCGQMATLDARDRLLGVVRVAARTRCHQLPDTATPYALHADWSVRRGGDAANATIFLPARWLHSSSEQPRMPLSTEAHCALQRLFAMAAKPLPGAAVKVRLPDSDGRLERDGSATAAVLNRHALLQTAEAVDVTFSRDEASDAVGPGNGVCANPPSLAQLVHRALVLLLLAGADELRRQSVMTPPVAVPRAAIERLDLSHTAKAQQVGLGRRPLGLPFACLEADYVLFNRELLPPMGSASLCESAVALPRGAGSSDTPWSSDNPGATTLHTGRSLAHLLARHERADDCNASRLMDIKLTPSGWFATISQVIKPLAQALRADKVLLMPRLPAYTLPACTARDLTCFFRPLSRCDSAVGARNREMKALNARSAAFVTQESTEAGKLVSLHQARNGRGTFRVFSELLAFLTRPIAKLASAIDAAHVSSGLAAAEREHDSPIVGLHIRRGDACGPGESERTARRCWPTSAYMERLLPYARHIGCKVIYVATDSKDALIELRKLYGAEFQVLSLDGVSRYRDKAPPNVIDARIKRYMNPKVNSTSWANGEAWRAIIDVELLARCDVLVGLFSSNLFRAAFAKRAAAIHAIPLYVSLDAPFCFDAGMLSGMNYEFPVRSAAALRTSWHFANTFEC